MGPFGPQNPAPLFGTKNVLIKPNPTIMKEKHVKGFLHAQNGTRSYEFIGFGLAEEVTKFKPGQSLHIAYHLEANNYLGSRTLILNLKDIRFDA